MIYGYIRTSTADQIHGIGVQRATITSKYTPDVWREEHASAKNTKGRPVFTKLLTELKSGDTLVVSKLDRFARSVGDAVAVAEDLDKRGVNLVIMDLNLDFATPIGKLMFSLLASVAEFERGLISQRTKESLAVVKATGQVLGNSSELDCDAVMSLRADGLSIREIAGRLGYSKSAVQRCLERSAL